MDIYVLFQSGLFDIRVKTITAVDAPVSFSSPVVQIGSAGEIKSLIESTVRSGGGLYDYGYRGLCIAVYKSTLSTFLAAESEVVSKPIKRMICQGLQRAETQNDSKVDAAWTLRNTLDAILEEFGFSDPVQGRWRPDATLDGESLGYECSGVTSGSISNGSTLVPQIPTAASDYKSGGEKNNDSISPSLNKPKTMKDDNKASSTIMESSSISFSSNTGIVAALTTSVLLYFELWT